MSEAGRETSSEFEQAGGFALRTLAFVAVASVGLGLVVQFLVFGVRLASDGGTPGISAAADIAQGVTWALLVCTGIGLGTTILRARARIVGLIGALIAPVAVAAAKGSQRLVSSMLDLSAQNALLALGALAFMRGIEYALLGFLLGTLAQRGEARMWRYLSVGAFVGIGIGGAIIVLNGWLAARHGLSFGAAQIATGVVNEVLFPIGCAFVIYASQLVGGALSRAELLLARAAE